MAIESKRVYELAKELGMSNKDFIEYIEKKLQITVKSHSSNLTAEQIEKIKASFSKKAGDAAAVKKPKAFIVKKAKQPSVPAAEEAPAVKKAEPAKKAVQETAEPAASAASAAAAPEKEEAAEEKPEKIEVKEPAETSGYRSLLEYNNKNSRKYKQEMLVKKQQQERAQQGRGSDSERSRSASDSARSLRPRPPFDKNKGVSRSGALDKTQDKPRGERPERAALPKKPLQHHIIPQEIYGNRPNASAGFKKTGAKDKKKQYKNKEEEQELISLEKTQTQKHKKKSKEDGLGEAVKQAVINKPAAAGELAEKIGKSPAEIVKFLMMEGILTTVNEILSVETQKKICAHFEIEVLDEDLNAYIEEELEKEEKEKKLKNTDESLLETRAPVVSIMGHVDHGKTTLLDSIRASKHKITASEAGGITQSIGAYTVYPRNDKKKKIVFIDTPGHEAFTEMRARGAKATDIAILVVAADDGIMPQTVEAINHAKAAEVPIIIAINKIDKADADPDRIMQQLTEYNLVPEEWGGDTICVKVSALQGKGIDELLDYILLLAEVQNLRADKTAPASGVIIESKLDKGKGPVATLLVQNGTLHTGDCFIAGSTGGKIRALLADSGERIKEAGPSTPVEILGLSEVPQAGDVFEAVSSEKEMKAVIEARKEKERASKLDSINLNRIRNEHIGGGDSNIKHLNLIIKANTHGSAEAVSQSVSRLESKEIITKIIHTGVGDISEADVMLASASDAVILGFSVKEDANAQAAAEKQGVTIKKYNIIYQVLEDLEQTMLSLLQPEIKEVHLGTAEVRKVFTIGKTSKIAGCYVTEGKIVRNKTAVVERDGIEIFRGRIDQLKRFKDDVKEAAQGFECGISFDKFNDIKEGDIIKALSSEEIERQVLV